MRVKGGGLRFSVIIPNYNYADFLGDAIDSALESGWPDIEVIVVDDGSTDDSRRVAEAYPSPVKTIFKGNGGQRSACNEGFAASSGDVIIFLDSDDVLLPGALQEIAAVYRPGVSKIQVLMNVIDLNGTSTGRVIPRLARAPRSSEVKSWFLRTSAYPTPPGSGNAYPRQWLESIFPLGDDSDQFVDSSLLASAPLHGDVVTVNKPLVGYRIHGSNDSALLADTTRFSREIARAVGRWRWAHRTVDAQSEAPWGPLYRSRELLQFRVAASICTPDYRGLPGDGKRRQFTDALSASFWPGPENVGRRAVVTLWCLLVLLGPRSLKESLITARYKR